MNKIAKASLALVVISIVILLVIFVQSLADEKKEYVTDPVIAHIPLEAHLRFSFDPDDPALMNLKYTLTPSVDVKADVSEGIVLPEGIVFVENNLQTGQITLRKGRKYTFNSKIKSVKTGIWRIYASPGVYADVNVFEGAISSVVGQGVFDATVPLTRFRLRAKVSKEGQDILMNITKNWLREYGAVEYGNEEFNCTIISANPDIRCYGCEVLSYSNSKLYDKYYFVIEEDQHTNKTKIRNVYRWAYQTPSGYQQKPVCEEITMKGGRNGE
ncbi:MAG: hypothetical protein C4B59_05360 [Candidatus Methanogaster sp.]|uniref:Uncharacterized protein n=1 Tax=Candidatus Methanogaster sp. TaxID=3386292 RepID=A0AC61L417_9EURY|nr:MAG: hypothetical protein C4B59_05360 [ANME-2 cluster archaeon]